MVDQFEKIYQLKQSLLYYQDKYTQTKGYNKKKEINTLIEELEKKLSEQIVRLLRDLETKKAPLAIPLLYKVQRGASFVAVLVYISESWSDLSLQHLHTAITFQVSDITTSAKLA